MEENKNVVGAKGGKVWSPPVPPAPASSPTLSPTRKPSRATSFSDKTTGLMVDCMEVSPTLFHGLIAAICIIWIAICLLLGVVLSHDEELSDVWEHEYGYQEVSLNGDETKAEVTLDNETIIVDALKYKGAMILFESQEQLYEKIEEVENGTYPEELYQP